MRTAALEVREHVVRLGALHVLLEVFFPDVRPGTAVEIRHGELDRRAAGDVRPDDGPWRDTLRTLGHEPDGPDTRSGADEEIVPDEQ